jgi:THUMP domain-like/RNA cap guanine-N2 methyltransferase
MEDDAVARFGVLRSVLGRQLLDELAGQEVTPGTALRVGSELRRRYPADLVAAAMAQHELRRQARAKFSRAMQMFFTRPGLEQSSSEVVARHRAARYAPFGRVADLCCGIGGDLLALAQCGPALGRRVLAVDRDPLHLRMAAANAGIYGVESGVTTAASDVRDVDLAGVEAVFVDPARRSAQRRMATGQSEPPLRWCLDLAGQVAAVGIKAAPGIHRDAVPPDWELEFVAVGRDLKEAAAWSPALATAARRATILPGGHTLTPRPGPQVPVAAPGAFLLDPSPAVTRAGLVEELARMLGAWKIDEQIAFLSSDAAMDTPFGRTLRVIDSAPWNQKQLAGRLRALDIGAGDIRRRGLAGDVGQLHRTLKLSGSRRATIVMTRVHDRPWGLICVDPARP